MAFGAIRSGHEKLRAAQCYRDGIGAAFRQLDVSGQVDEIAESNQLRDTVGAIVGDSAEVIKELYRARISPGASRTARRQHAHQGQRGRRRGVELEDNHLVTRAIRTGQNKQIAAEPAGRRESTR